MCKICLLRLLDVDGWLKKYWKVFHTLCQSIFICYLHRRDSPSIFLPCCSYVPPMCKPISRDLVIMLTKMYRATTTFINSSVSSFPQEAVIKALDSRFSIPSMRNTDAGTCGVFQMKVLTWQVRTSKYRLLRTGVWRHHLSSSDGSFANESAIINRMNDSNKNGPTWFSVSVLSHSYR